MRALLLLGSAQFGNLTSAHRPLIIEELSFCGGASHVHAADYCGKEVPNGVNHFIKMLKKMEHPDDEPNQDDAEEMNRRAI